MKPVSLKRRNFVYALLCVFVAAGGWAAIYMASLGSTAEKRIDVTDLYEDPEAYDSEDAGGIADIIITEDLKKTGAINAVTAVVFDFRGYDTIGESFVLLTAISGSMVILRRSYYEDKERKLGDGKKR